ncbi:MAG: hypothetical protein NXI16_02950 [Alphaproteobacteria bacterium]|nr:hypothetical protein [Alphaproteobacteria bacterium]
MPADIPPPPEDFEDIDAVQAWLEGQDRSWSIALAARSALRALPFVGQAMSSPGADPVKAADAIVSPMFRASALPWLAGTWPSHGNDLRPAADSADSAALSAAFSAALSALSADSAALSAALSAARSDCLALRDGTTAPALLRRPLWPDGSPEVAGEAWSALAEALRGLDAGWEVWTGWYEARLRGQEWAEANGLPLIRELEIRRATLKDDPADFNPDDALWKQGPAAVNARIRQIEQEYDYPRRRMPEPVQDVRAAVEFDELADGRIGVSGGFGSEPDLSPPHSASDLANRLEACREAAADLIDEIDSRPRNFPKDDYTKRLRRYGDRLPTDETGNFYGANMAMVQVHRLLRSHLDELPNEIAVDLSSLIALHIETRRYYPGFIVLEDTVRHSPVTDRAPQQEIEAILTAIRDDESGLFDEEVPRALDEAVAGNGSPGLTALVASRDDALLPPRDSALELDPDMVRDYDVVTRINSLYRVLRKKGKKAKLPDASKEDVSAVAASYTIAEALAPVLSWLLRFLGM